MVIATTACVAVVVTGGAALPVVGEIAITSGTLGATAGMGAGTASAVAGAVGAAASSGAIAGAAAGTAAGATAAATAAGVGIGAAAGGTAAAGVGGSSAGLAAIVSGSLTGGLGFLVVGKSTNQEDEHITYDCWKPVVHDVSEEPSNGMYLKDIISHPNIQRVTMVTGCYTNFPNIVIENIWKEEFQIEYLMLNTTGKIVCHAKQM